MMAQATAIRDYTDKRDRAAAGRPAQDPLPAAHRAVLGGADQLPRAAQQFPDYSYREPALNPTNPADRATDWEADIIDVFKRDPGAHRARHRRATRRRADPVDLAADPHHRPGLPGMPFDAGRGAGDDDRPVWHRQRLRLEAGRRDRRADRLGADAASRWSARNQTFITVMAGAGGGVRRDDRADEPAAALRHREADTADVRDRQRGQPGQHGRAGIRRARPRRDRLAGRDRSTACGAAWRTR